MAVTPLVAPARSPEEAIAWMETLADPTRLRLLRLLEKHELGVAELVDIVQLPQSTVSRHLKILADQGWVASRAQRTNNLYRMAGDEDAVARRLWQWAREQTASWPSLRHDELRLRRRLAQRPSAQAFFAGAASQWDRLRAELYGRAFQEAALAALLPGEWTVADLGCGTGAVAAALAPHVARVIGVDQSASMLKAARRRVAGHGNVDLRRGDLEELPVESGTCDGALLLLALTYVPDPAAVLAEAARILRPGGRLVVVDLLHHDRDDFQREMEQVRPGFETAELAELMAGAGLEGVRCQPLAPEPQAKGPALVLAAGRRPARDKKKGESR